MISSVGHLSARISDPSVSATSTGKTGVPSFTRRLPPEPIHLGPSKIKDKGGIDPTTALYGQIQATAHEALVLGQFSNGAQLFGEMDFGPTHAHSDPMGTHEIHGQQIGNEIHTVISQNGMPLHFIRFVPGANANPGIFLNGQELTPRSPLSDLHIVRTVTHGS
jgi:hypothetical protein